MSLWFRRGSQRSGPRELVLNIGATDFDDLYLTAAAAVRIPLAILLLLLGSIIPDDQVRQPAYLVVALGYLALALGWLILLPRVFRGTTWGRFSPLADLAALVILSLLSGGATSLLQPAFFLLPLAVAFSELSWLTGLLGFLTAVAYLVIWLNAPVNSGAPVIWLHFGFLVWLALAATVLSELLARRSRRLAQLVVIQRQLVNQSLKIEEQQRAQFAEDLHDGPLQLLLVSRMDLEEITGRDFAEVTDPSPGQVPDPERTDGPHPPPTRSDLERVGRQLRECATEIRSVVTGLHPQVLGQLGIAAGITELARHHQHRTRVPVEVRATSTPPAKTDQLVYGLTRELLVNVGKHARAGQIQVHYGPYRDDTGPLSPPGVVLRVRDDGIGFDPAIIAQRVAAGHIGLAAHAARILGAGGTFTINPAPGGGTVVTAVIPVTPDNSL